MELKLEKALERLEEIVQQLEQQEVSLDDSLKLFEEGVKLADSVQKKLSDAQLRIKKVVSDAQGFRAEDFEM
ncbi:exodeoxyribonuclease VII small subunit [Candidatus Acetothermia bacterium]|nr:exodeoxyribonuclease VII small subunit [Candidatus Acetothermia bacterium]MBI3660316.1 exodeoxyribonuclease VII small subunit [Candidatus Acetothermia bacterium]